MVQRLLLPLLLFASHLRKMLDIVLLYVFVRLRECILVCSAATYFDVSLLSWLGFGFNPFCPLINNGKRFSLALKS